MNRNNVAQGITEEEKEEEKEKTVNSDNESVHDISDYLHLVGTLHFDPDENSVYKTTRVVEIGEYIAVYRRRQLKNGQWARESTQSIFAKDVVVMTELYSPSEAGGINKKQSS